MIEGAITIVFGLVAWHYLPDFPDRNQFLTQEQTALVLRRIEHDRGDSLPDTPTWTKILLYLRDWKLWVYGKSLKSILVVGTSFTHPRSHAHVLNYSCVRYGVSWAATVPLDRDN